MNVIFYILCNTLCVTKLVWHFFSLWPFCSKAVDMSILFWICMIDIYYCCGRVLCLYLKIKKKLAMNSVENYIYIYWKRLYIYTIHTHKYESILEMHCNENKMKQEWYLLLRLNYYSVVESRAAPIFLYSIKDCVHYHS